MAAAAPARKPLIARYWKSGSGPVRLKLPARARSARCRASSSSAASPGRHPRRPC